MITVAMTEPQLRAGARVLRQLLAHEHPMVHRAACEALGELRAEDALRCVTRMEAALLFPIESRVGLDQTLDAIKQDAIRAVSPEGQRR